LIFTAALSSSLSQIIPPPEWRPQFAFDSDADADALRFHTRLQRVDGLQQGTGFDAGGAFTLRSFQVRGRGNSKGGPDGKENRHQS
jgi:hypothetical protein